MSATPRTRTRWVTWCAVGAGLALAVGGVGLRHWYWDTAEVPESEVVRIEAGTAQQLGDYEVKNSFGMDMTGRFDVPAGYRVLFIPTRTTYTGTETLPEDAGLFDDAETPGLQCSVSLRVSVDGVVREYTEGLPDALPAAPFSTAAGACGMVAGEVGEVLGYGFFLVPDAGWGSPGAQDPVPLAGADADVDGVWIELTVMDESRRTSVMPLEELLVDDLPDSWGPTGP